MKKRTIYINGKAESTKAVKLLELQAKAGTQKVYGKITKGGNIAFRTEF